MKQVNAKKITYWLLGETAGRTSVAVWKRLWGMPVEAGGKVAQKVAQESIASMQGSIAQLSTAVAKIVSTYNLAQQQYNNKLKDRHEAERQAQLAHSKGNKEAARLAITKAIAQGLEISNTRSDLQNALHNFNLNVAGANSQVQFFPSGDRTINIALVKVKANPKQGYYFELLADK